MRYALKTITPPTMYPVDRDDIFNMVKLDSSNPALIREAVFIEDLIASATAMIEDYCGRAFITQTLELTLIPDIKGFFNVGNQRYLYETLPQIIKLWRPPCQSVTSFTVIDQAGTSHLQPAGRYATNTSMEPAEIQLMYGAVWEYYIRGYYVIRYIAGYGDTIDTIPPQIRNAIRLTVAQWYASRENLDYTIPAQAVDLLSHGNLKIEASDLGGDDIPFAASDILGVP